MACIPLLAPMAVATTRLARIIYCEDASAWQIESSAERNSLRASWVVVTDSDGNRKLQMQWAPVASNFPLTCDA